MPNSPKKLNRSKKLRKYAKVYKSILRDEHQSKNTKSPRKKREKTSRHLEQTSHRRISNKASKITAKKTKKSNRRVLNEYQKFVKKESKKPQYADMPGKKRLSIIAEEWKKYKNSV